MKNYVFYVFRTTHLRKSFSPTEKSYFGKWLDYGQKPITQISFTAKPFLSKKKKTANNIFKSHKKHKNIQNIPVFVKVSS